MRTLIAGKVALLLVLAVSAQAADKTQFFARSGSKMRLEGTSNIHDWQVESPIIGGSLEVGPEFPTEPGQAATPGKVEAKADVSVMVRSLKSVEKDGKPYSDKMDEIMWEKLGIAQTPKIFYRLSELTLKEAAKSKDAPYVFDAKGEMVVGGVTNTVSMPVNVTPLGDKKLRITGNTTVKMSSFKIEPPAPKIALGMIKTGDDVKVIFDWMVAQRPAPAAAAAK
ncbi:MAG TPA: YceI family protein [Candidatus Sulfotelmatobacter sp.]|nr:YceI family protein [Candidatus Sulfotelmatobacter sp.]